MTAGYHRRRSGPAIGDDELIDNPDWHFRYRGFKFANPEVVLEQKDFYRREKDVRDVEEAGRRLAVTDPVGFDPSFHLAACTEALLRQAMGSSSPSSRAADRQPLAATVKSVLRRVRRRLASAPRRD